MKLAVPRSLIGVLALALAATAYAQGGAKLTRIGFLSAAEPELSLDPLRDGLVALGYVEGRNISFQVHFALRDPSRLDKYAGDLVQSRVDVIVAGGSDAIRAAMRATRDIPIVMTQASDAVASGFVANLSRPGGNVTGISSQTVDVGAKRVQLVRELLPNATRLAIFINPGNPSHDPGLKVIQAAAQSMGMSAQPVAARSAAQLQAAFTSIAQMRTDALLVLPDNMLFNERLRIIQFARSERIASVYWRREFAESEGLIAYGQDNVALYRQAAAYVHRIIKGARPQELAVEQPDKFQLVINMRTARAQGITIPKHVLVRADLVIE